MSRFASAALAVAPGPDAVRDKLHDILSRPEFGEPKRAWWLESLAEFFAWLGKLHGAAPGLYWLLLGSLLVLLVLLLVRVASALRRAVTRVGRATREEAAAQERRRRSLACREEAGRLAGAGEFTEAVRYLFLALLYRFDESGRVLFQRALTNREYLDLFSGRPRIQADLRTYVEVLDDHWYGQRPADRGTFDRCQALFRELEGMTG
jgi:hypothetical protein